MSIHHGPKLFHKISESKALAGLFSMDNCLNKTLLLLERDVIHKYHALFFTQESNKIGLEIAGNV